MHGNRANIILFKQLEATEIFRNHLDSDFQIKLSELDKEIDWSKEEFVNHLTNLPPTYITFGKPVWEYLNQKNFQSAENETKWNLFQETVLQLGQPIYYILEKEKKACD